MSKTRAIDVDDRVTGFAELGFATEDELDAYIQEGIDSVEQHGTIPHAVVMAEMRAIIAKHRG